MMAGKRVDARGQLGTLPAMMAREEMASMGKGEALVLVYDSPETVEDLEELAARGFWQVESHGEEMGALVSRLRKA
jgi:TusA-related sulfurtransferase